MDAELVRELIAYEPISGKFYWKHRDVVHFRSEASAAYWNKTYAFQECMRTKDAQGYNIGSIKGKNQYAHRVAWAITHGVWPNGEIDHINGVRNDNRLENLRSVAKVENGRNQGLKASNTSGVNGVIWDKKRKRWTAAVKYEGKLKHLGSFRTIEEAAAARKAADLLLGFHPNHGERDAVPTR